MARKTPFSRDAIANWLAVLALLSLGFV